MSCFVAFHYRSYGTFFLQQNRLHNIYRGFTHYKYYRASYGFEMAGFNVLLGIDNDEKALETFQKNHQNSEILCGDIANISYE